VVWIQNFDVKNVALRAIAPGLETVVRVEINTEEVGTLRSHTFLANP